MNDSMLFSDATSGGTGGMSSKGLCQVAKGSAPSGQDQERLDESFEYVSLTLNALLELAGAFSGDF